jgi:NAD-dependent deacetylase
MAKVDWQQYKNLVVLTGAGISAASGLATFRDSNGLWENHRVEDVATPEAFHRDPTLVWRFYSMRRLNAGAARPNAAHLALDQFAAQFKGRMTLVTQNVDGLHQRARHAGHLDPLCMHGTLERSRCTACATEYWDDMAWLPSVGMPRSADILSVDQRASSESLTQYKVQLEDGLPLSPCCQTLLRPHIVWFGETPLHMERIYRELSSCDLFMSIGTSGHVYPAAGFLEIAKEHQAHTIVINKEPLPQHPYVDTFIQGAAEEKVPGTFRLT